MNQAVRKTLNAALVILGIVMLVYAAWNWVASIRLNRAWQAQAKRGLPMSASEIMPTPVQEDENAATFLRRAFKYMERGAAGMDKYNKSVGALLNYSFSDGAGSDKKLDPRDISEENTIAIQALLSSAPITKALDQLSQAAQKHECNFGIDYANGTATLLPHLSHVHNAVKLLTLRAWVQADTGNFSGALKDIHTALRISNFMKSEPTMISQLLRIRCNKLSLLTLNMIINKADPDDSSAPYLTAISVQLEMQEDKNNRSFIAALDGERILLGNWSYQRIIRGKIEAKELEAMGMPNSLRFYHSVLSSPWVKTDFRCYLLTMDKYRAMAAKHFYEIARQLPLSDSIPKYYPLTGLSLPVMDKAYALVASDHARIALARIGVMIALHAIKEGRTPTDLGELPMQADFPRDPFSGKHFLYKQTNEGHRLYSIGPDMQDDQGTVLDTQSQKGDIVWMVRK